MTTADTQRLLDKAVAAVRVYLAGMAEEGTHPQVREEIGQRATDAVTAAVRGGVHHRQIASLTGAPGLLVIGLIATARERAEALIAEDHHAARYQAEVRGAMRTYARQVVGSPDPETGRYAEEKAQVAGWLHVSRPTLDKWLATED